MKNIIITILVVVITLSIGSMIIFNLDALQENEKPISGISVFVNDADTTATYATAAIYRADGSLLATTNEKELVMDSWNILSFQDPVQVNADNEEQYIIMVSGNGDISIPSTGEDYISQATDGYGSFPDTLSDFSGSSSKLSIYAIYS